MKRCSICGDVGEGLFDDELTVVHTRCLKVVLKELEKTKAKLETTDELMMSFARKVVELSERTAV